MLSTHRALALGLAVLVLALGAIALAVSSPKSPSRPLASRSHLNTSPSSTVPASTLPLATDNRMLVPVPKSLSIPRLSVSGAPVVEQVGVQTSGIEKGLLSAPSDFHELGWYEHDGTGVLVIDGHVGFAAGAGPLAYIGELSPGNSVLVRFASGTKTYRVVTIDKALKGRLSPAYFSKAYDGDLMLITCDYQSAFHNGHFADNVFVIAKPARA